MDAAQQLGAVRAIGDFRHGDGMSALADLLAGFRLYLAQRNDALGGFTDGFDWAMAGQALASRDLPVVAYLPTLTPPGRQDETALLNLLRDISGILSWAQTYSINDFGPAFLDRYGWVELFGTRGHFASDVMAGGFLLLGPQIHYPDHHHIAEEIYIPLTSGSLWSKDGGPFEARAAGEIIHHPSNIRHAMQTNEDPLVALYLWRGGPLAQKSTISGRDT
jgi:Dimethlysulfonioproprionate lyase